MEAAKKELAVILAEVNETITGIEKDIISLSYQKDKLGGEYYGRAAELKAQLLQGYRLKMDITLKLNHV